MDPRYWYGLAPAVVGAAFLAVTSAQAADTTKTQPSATTPPASTTPAQTPAAKPRTGEDDAVEFDKLDKNKDGFLDKGEAMMEPRLLAEWAKVDTNNDGKISKAEFLAFEQARHAKK